MTHYCWRKYQKRLVTSYSNWGACVDIYAPGDEIASSSISSRSVIESGTSMATPFVSGLLAYFLSLHPEGSSEYAQKVDPIVLKKRIIAYGTKGKLTGLHGESPNILAFNGAGSGFDYFWNKLQI